MLNILRRKRQDILKECRLASYINYIVLGADDLSLRECLTYDVVCFLHDLMPFKETHVSCTVNPFNLASTNIRIFLLLSLLEYI